MKKKFISALLLVTSLMAEIVSITPYGGQVSYDKESTKSIKNKATLYGVHTSIGNLNYLLELDYLKTDISYKDTSIENLDQDDITLTYGVYFTNIMLRGGLHYINTNDPQLGDAYVGFASLGAYNYVGYDKYSYGIEAYYSKYQVNNISLTQYTPYLSAYNALSLNWGNSLNAKFNYQVTPDYLQDTYLSYELSDTLYYKSIFLTLHGYVGEMVSGVKDSGMTVINTLDLMKIGYGTKVGYYFTPDAILSVSYDINSYEEVDLNEEGKNSVIMASFYYGF